MRKVAIITVLAVLTAVGFGAVGAGAAVPRGQISEFCEALGDIGTQLDPSVTGIEEDAADAVADGMRDAAKLAPRRVKKAMKRLAKLYDRITDEESVVEIFSNRRFARDTKIYTTYILDECLDFTVPTS